MNAQCYFLIFENTKTFIFQEVLPEPQRAFPPLTKTQISFSEEKRKKTKNMLKKSLSFHS